LCGTTTAYATSANTDVAARRGCPSRHVPAIRNPSASTDDESYHSSASELPPATSHGYAEWDFSGVPDLVMFRRFLHAADYCFGYSDDSSTGSYDPARECFVVVADDQANSANAGPATEKPLSARKLDYSRARGRVQPPPRQRGGGDINVQLAQARELEAKLTEEYRTVRLLRTSIAGEASARGECARELGKQARDRINADFDVDNPSTPPRPSQKLIAAEALLRAMPAPSTPEAQNLHREAQALVEQAAVQQAESSTSRIRHQGST
jgi:hypothetical protein